MNKHALRPHAVFTLALCLVTALAYAEVLELEGTVKAVDAKARTIIIERKTPKGTKTLGFEVAKNAGDLGSFEVGDRVSFAYNPDVEIISKIEKELDEKTQRALKELEGVWMATKVNRHGTMMPLKDLKEQSRRIIIEGKYAHFRRDQDGKGREVRRHLHD